jgi:hypothetical protein
MHESENKIIILSAKQLGLVTASQCVSVGVSRKIQERRLSQGDWQRLYRDVFKIGTSPVSFDEKELGTLLHAGDEAALSHFSAARRLGLETPRSANIHLSIPSSRRVTGLSEVIVCRSRQFSNADITTRGLFRLTKLGRTILDLSPLLDNGWLRAVIDSALRKTHRNLRWIKQALDEHGFGHKGAARLRRLLKDYEEGAEVPDSVFESFVVELTAALRDKPILHHNLHNASGAFIAEVDLAWPEAKLAIELDGWKDHGNKTAFHKDRARDRKACTIDWKVMRYTWHDVAKKRDRQNAINEVMHVLELRK